MKKSRILLLAVLLIFINAFGQEKTTTPEDYIRSRTTDLNGDEIVGIIVPGKPPDKHREPVATPTRSTVLLSNVPAFDWSFGCSATSAAMAAGYYDNSGYPNMYTGPTNGGVMPMNNSSWGYVVINGETRAQCPLSATRNTVDGRTVNGNVDDYWIQYNHPGPDPFIANGWEQHTYGDCTGDFMGTNQSALGNVDGGTTFYNYTNGSPLHNYTGCEPGQIDGCHGLRDFYESRGYTVNQNYSQYIFGYNGNTLGFTFDQYKLEIDAGRPVIIQVAGHSMLGFGYDDAGNTVYLHDTWDYNSHTMTWGGSYSGMVHYGVCVVELEPPANDYTPGLWTGAASSDWNTASNWDDGNIPTSTTNINIFQEAPHWPNYPGDFTVGAQCANMNIPEGSEMTVNGNFTINDSCSLTFNGAGVLKIGADWTNNGNFSPGEGTVNFFGTDSSVVHAPPASAANYALTSFTKGMTPLSGATLGPSGDQGGANIEIGFTFIYCGVSYSNIRFCTNGWLSFDLSGVLSYDNTLLFTSAVPNTTLAPWWDDLADDGTSKLYYKTEGAAPNRVFTAEWYRVRTYSSNATSRISFQVKLFETTNIIEFHYGNHEDLVHSTLESASIGIEDATGGSGHFIDATTGSTTTGISTLKSATQWPTVNYRFTPAEPVQTFNNITISKNSASVDFNATVNIEGTLNVMPGAAFKVISGMTMNVADGIR